MQGESLEKIIPINIEEEMKTAYIDYSMSVIISRALPDVRDGLKPVHRRVLYGMRELGLASNRPFKKSARIVGEVLGKYHPHGDSSVYDAMVRMAQPWSMRYPLVDGQGNFGSIDGDSPAAMRYTEARLKRIAEEMLADIEKNTVDFRLNFDDSLEEPTVLPSAFPNLLVNGSSGIAVGMATNMAPHNLRDVVDAIIAYIDNKEISIDELIHIIKAPDFPTGGIIYGYSGVREAYETGRGRIIVRAKAHIETLPNGREQIVVTEIPYQVNKADMLEKTARLVEEKKLEGISDIRDESDRKGLRIVYEIKKDAIAHVVLNNLFKHTDLQSTFSVNNIALVKGRPMLLNLKELIRHFVDHRHEVVVRRTRFELDEAEKKAHILEGLLIALDHLDEVISLIRNSDTPETARDSLMERFGLTEAQAKAILDMRLQRLTGLEREKIREEHAELVRLIEYYRQVLADEGLRMKIIKDELIQIKEKYGDDRRTEIVYSGDDMRLEDLIEDEAVVVTISHMGYIKRTPLSEYRQQNRGGMGSRASGTREDDFLEHLFVATAHNYLLLFTEKGRCYWLRVFEIPEGDKTSRGRPIQNLINIDPGDKIKAYIAVRTLTDKEYLHNNFIVMCTRQGIIKKTTLEAYSRPRSSGIAAIQVRQGDELIEARLTDGKSDIIIAVRSGRAIRFPETKVRPMGRTSIGVRGITLDPEKDEVVGMICISDPRHNILVVSENGYGKQSALEDYRITNRGGKGVKTMKITPKTGALVGIVERIPGDDLMIITRRGTLIRLNTEDLRVMGRATQGVRLINLRENDAIAAIARVPSGLKENNTSQEENALPSPSDNPSEKSNPEI
ncbi:MAG: DNA gyrase subunit A [Flavobacteriales bacterium]|nr:DNA gyrase subunit A [Flavobacteriales bacterium]MCX7767999.1 DNA gyrase subunit A [Flavobacteriales bacterium]MDW8409204.1 DNA gyrase subunit A [Flavobacteriales bacterium]